MARGSRPMIVDGSDHRFLRPSGCEGIRKCWSLDVLQHGADELHVSNPAGLLNCARPAPTWLCIGDLTEVPRRLSEQLDWSKPWDHPLSVSGQRCGPVAQVSLQITGKERRSAAVAGGCTGLIGSSVDPGLQMAVLSAKTTLLLVNHVPNHSL